MVKFKTLLLAAFIAIAGSAQAALIEFDGSTNIISSTSVTAGPMSIGQWYGSNYSTANGYAEMTESSGFLKNLLTGSGTNSLAYAVSLDGVAPGTYSWSIDTRYSSITQFNYGQVYLLKNGQNLSLEGGIWRSKPAGSTVISADFSGLFSGDGKWHTYGDSFKLTASQISNYDVVAFVFTGSKSSGQVLQYDNFNSDLAGSTVVPEPATIAFVGSGALLILLRKKEKR